jgi:endo-1,4-beta-xylanase
MDVSVTPLVAPPLLRLARQAEVYAESAAACNEVAACTRFTVWGVDDAHSWIGEDKRGLLFDSGYAPKPALDAVRSAFAPRGG